jgi:hypothetical protein
MTVSYVYFVKETEEIASIGNFKKESELDFIEVPESLILPIMTGREPLRDYKVSFDIKLGEYVFTAKMDVHESISVTWNDSVYKVPETTSISECDIKITTKKNKWTIEASDNVRAAFGKTKDSPYHYFELYITRRDDANVLLKILPIKSNDLIENKEIIFDNIDIREPSSVYCKKIFETYAHIIDDEN